jgi:hypothetical protein
VASVARISIHPSRARDRATGETKKCPPAISWRFQRVTNSRALHLQEFQLPRGALKNCGGAARLLGSTKRARWDGEPMTAFVLVSGVLSRARAARPNPSPSTPCNVLIGQLRGTPRRGLTGNKAGAGHCSLQVRSRCARWMGGAAAFHIDLLDALGGGRPELGLFAGGWFARSSSRRRRGATIASGAPRGYHRLGPAMAGSGFPA